MKKLLTILLGTALVTSVGCKTSQKNYTKISESEYKESALQGRFPLADSSFSYNLEGTAGMELEETMDYYMSNVYPNLKDRASVLQFGQNIAVYLDRGDVFDFADYELKDYAKRTLRELATHLRKRTDTYILVTGRTDAIGAKDYNDDLAYLRAAVAANYLNELGIDEDRFYIDSFGENFPHFTNYIPEGRAKNRRVDLLIVPNNEMREDASK